MVLFGSKYWNGLLSWIKDFALNGGKVSPQDLKLVHVTDSPADVVQFVIDSQSSLRVLDKTMDQEAQVLEDVNR